MTGPPAAEATSGDALEALARAAYLDLEFPQTIRHWEAAYAAHREAGTPVGAVRVARMLGCIYGMVVGDGAVSAGWLARAQTLLPGAGSSSEAGWVVLTIGMFEADRPRKEARFRDALDVARRLRDTDLEFVALAYLGASLVHGDHVEEGMLLLDEALAAVAGRDVEDFFALEEIFCQLFAACEHAHDVARADQWMRVGDAVAERQNLPAVSAYCRTHYGGVLTAAGRWTEADVALTDAVRLWGLEHRSALRSGALIRLADLRVRQGRHEEAEQLLAGLELDVLAARPLAVIHLARGETVIARDVLDRALDRLEDASAATALPLALLVDVHLAANNIDEAHAAVRRLEQCAVRHPSHYLRGVAALARGRIHLVAATGDARACLRDAMAEFAQAQMPMELARSRLDLASVLIAEAPEVALAEARAALDTFERLQAARDVDACGAVLRSLGVRTGPGKRSGGLLSKRESEVLELVGLGLSNPEISERLYISRKTVEHHVGNILAKLGLRNRVEAAAYSARASSGRI